MAATDLSFKHSSPIPEIRALHANPFPKDLRFTFVTGDEVSTYESQEDASAQAAAGNKDMGDIPLEGDCGFQCVSALGGFSSRNK